MIDIEMGRTPWADPEHDVMRDLRDATRPGPPPPASGDLQAAIGRVRERFSVPEPRCWGACQSGRTRRVVTRQQYLTGPTEQVLGSRMILHDVDRCPEAALYAVDGSVRVFEVVA